VKGTAMDATPMIGSRVRVHSLDTCAQKRPFLYCQQRPEPCPIHGFAHDGTIYLDGHDPVEAGHTGEIVSFLTVVGAEDPGHQWIVRFDENLMLRWPNGHQSAVNGGAYSSSEIELLPA
jgi:hypothetical protein